MTAAPRVSVVMIFLNAEKFIGEAIDSVLVQSFANWELLLIDDGSTDSSTAIARMYQARRPDQVHYLEHDGHANRGMSASRNVGVAQATGELIAFLDADDVWLPDKLERQVALMQRHPDVGLVANPALYWYADGTKKPQAMTLPAGRLQPGAWLPLMLESDDAAACPSTVLMRKELALRVGGFEESFRGMFEDQAMWFKVSLNALVYYDPESVILYRIHPEACCSATPPAAQLEARIRLYTWLVEYLGDSRHHGGQPRSLLVMVRSKLCAALLDLGEQRASAAAGALPAGRLRFRARLTLVWPHRASLGYLFVALFVGGGVSSTATALSRRLFRLARGAYRRREWRLTRAAAPAADAAGPRRPAG